MRGGTGGDGCVSFRREKYVPRGGPDGGDGGDGGNVILCSDPNLSTLLDVARRSLYAAQNGRRGRGAERTGKRGSDLVVGVPVGTVIREIREGHPPGEGKLLGELLHPGQLLVVARGGKGGRGNKAFATATRQTPRFAEEGGACEERLLYLELKLLADVGLIGLPNAGKSTLLKRISAASPKIAMYPFTTLQPNLGIVELGDYRRLVIADIPGLIEGAHKGLGLGIEFLRHIERTRVLVHLVSVESLISYLPAISGQAGSGEPGREEKKREEWAPVLASLENDYRKVERELNHYSPELSKKSRTVVLSKIDLIPRGEREYLAQLFSRSLEAPVRAISGITGEGLPALLQELDENVRRLQEAGTPLPSPED